MNKSPHLKHVKSIDDSLDNTDLDSNIIDLMHFVPKLTEKQAKQTLDLFPDLEYGIPIANYFFSHKEVMKAYSSYSNYLGSVYSAMNPSESIFEEEVRCRTCGLFDKILDPRFSTGYRNKPRYSEHFHEHFASQDDSSETDPTLIRAYSIRRSLTGL